MAKERFKKRLINKHKNTQVSYCVSNLYKKTNFFVDLFLKNIIIFKKDSIDFSHFYFLAFLISM